MDTMLAKTPLSACAKPFCPKADMLLTQQQGSNAPQCYDHFVSWMPASFIIDFQATSDFAQKSESVAWSTESDQTNFLRGRTRTKERKQLMPSRTPSPSASSVCFSEASTTAESSLTQEGSLSPISTSDASDFNEECVPVKNTFVHFNNDHYSDEALKKLSRSSSAPGTLLSCDFQIIRQPTVLELHERGECNPCAYFYLKADGCRRSSECKFCHLCPAGELKIRKKQRNKALKLAKRAALEAQEAVLQGDAVAELE